MAEPVDEEREARIVLTAVSESRDTINGTLAALLCASVTVEVVRRSGSLSKARFADAFGPPACAAPGPVARQASAGCHRLLQERIINFVVDTQDLITVLDSNAGFSGDRTFAHSFTKRSSPKLKV